MTSVCDLGGNGESAHGVQHATSGAEVRARIQDCVGFRVSGYMKNAHGGRLAACEAECVCEGRNKKEKPPDRRRQSDQEGNTH